ncbi:MAG: hypothetical protein ACFFAU_03775 [Candidatus Hodarchaeota archaeon]
MPTIFDSFQKGKTQSKDWVSQFENFRTIRNAFNDSFILKSPDSFVHTQEVHRLSQLLGQMLNSKLDASFLPQILVFGPRRCGKSATAKQIAFELNKSIDTNYARYLTYDSNFFQKWEDIDFSPTQIFFLDNIYPIWGTLSRQSYFDLLERSDYDKIIIVTILNSIEQYWLKNSQKSARIQIFGQEPFEFKFKRPSNIEIQQIIKKRTEILGKPDLFSQNVLNDISVISLGLPGIALWLIRQLFSHIETQESVFNITTELLHKTAQYLGFQAALKIVVEHNLRFNQQENSIPTGKTYPILQPLLDSNYGVNSPLLEYLKNVKGVIKSSIPVLEEMLLLKHEDGSIKRSELQEKTGIKESSLTYQCQKLVKEKIVNYTKIGREVYYELRSPVKEALELTFLG